MSVRVSRLDNGISIVTDQCDWAETVAIEVMVGHGSRHDPLGKEGLAHFAEHMAFEGAGGMTSADISVAVERHGGDLNGWTDRDEFGLTARVLQEDTDHALSVLCLMLRHPTLPREAHEREIGVIIQEIASDLDDPNAQCGEAANLACYGDDPWARPVPGPQTSVTRITGQDVAAVVRNDWSVTAGTIVSAAGRLDHDATVAMVQRYFGDMPHRAGQPDPDPAWHGGGFRADMEVEQACFNLVFFGVPFGHPDLAAQQVLATALGGSSSSRLFRTIREERGLAYSVGAHSCAQGRTGRLSLWVSTGAAELNQTIRLMCEIYAQVCREGLTDAELARAQALVRAGHRRSLESVEARRAQAAIYLRTMGQPIDHQALLADVMMVDQAAVKRVLDRTRAAPPAIAAAGPLGSMMSDATIGGWLEG